MTDTTPRPIAAQVMEYDTGGRMARCPLCRTRPLAKKTYGHDICKKCHYAFANRRQIGYLIDALLVYAIAFATGMVLGLALRFLGVPIIAIQIYAVVLGAVVGLAFVFKDGFGGYSPGKYLMGLRVLETKTGKPAGFVRSFKRNSILLLGLIPIVGGWVSGVFIVIIAFQVARGFRFGDGFAETRVIWKKYAHLPIFGGDAVTCEGCGYDLRGNMSGTCPECGVPVSERIRGILAGAQPAAAVVEA